MNRVEREEAPEAMPPRSTRQTSRPRSAASPATQLPVAPPPTTSRSKTLDPRACKCCSRSQVSAALRGACAALLELIKTDSTLLSREGDPCPDKEAPPAERMISSPGGG